MEFQDRLERAIQRGRRQSSDRAEEEAQRHPHGKGAAAAALAGPAGALRAHRACLGQLADRFPGFRFETIVDPRGWGAVLSRDDLRLERGQRRTSCFSRLEMLVTPATVSQILELSAKGTVCNREIFSRTQYQRLAELDLPVFTNLIDLWVLEYAERYAAQ